VVSAQRPTEAPEKLPCAGLCSVAEEGRKKQVNSIPTGMIINNAPENRPGFFKEKQT
jgi:hypothetical protein